MEHATISKLGGDKGRPVIFIVRCPGGTEHEGHGKVYQGTSPSAAYQALAEHITCVPRLDENVAFMFTTVDERHEVNGRFMAMEDLQRTHGGRKSRVYVSLKDGDVKLPRPPYTERGEDPENDKAWDAYNRAEVQAMKDKAESSVYDALVEGGYLATYTKFSFSKKAGCGCGCSPGLIATGQIRADQHRYGSWYRTGVDVWIS